MSLSTIQFDLDSSTSSTTFEFPCGQFEESLNGSDVVVDEFKEIFENATKFNWEEKSSKLLDLKIEFLYSDQFDCQNAAEAILSEEEGCSLGECKTDKKAPAGTPPYLAALYGIPLLTKKQEQYLFRKMNFLKFRASQIQLEALYSETTRKQIDLIETYLAEAMGIRNHIVSANLRLVVSIAKKFVNSNNSFHDLVSDGNVPLIRAVEIFDFERGTRFSTYGTWAVQNSLKRSSKKSYQQKNRFPTGNEIVFESSAESRSPVGAKEKYHTDMKSSVNAMLSPLDERDQKIVRMRFGLDQTMQPQKFREIAQQLQISTERVRQLLLRAMRKMKDFAELERMNLELELESD